MVQLNSPLYSKHIVSALRQIMQHMDHHSRKLDKHYGITMPQLMCLTAIQEKNHLTLSELAKEVHLSASTLVGVINRLEEKGFVKRTRDTEDRRTVFIAITDKGIAFITDFPYSFDMKLAELPENEQIAIIHSLDRLVILLDSKSNL